MIYIKRIFAFIPSINKDIRVSFSALPYLSCSHIYGPAARQELDLRQPTQTFKALHFRFDVSWFELFLRNINH